MLPDDQTTGFHIWAHVPFPRYLFIALAGAAGLVFRQFITSSFGRVARYTRSTPNNIAARAAVRQRGLDLLEALHKTGDRYSRIIVVGHSLGSILAYEILAFFWARHAAARKVENGTMAFELLCSLERAAEAIHAKQDDPGLIAEWLMLQRALGWALASRPAPADQAPSVDSRWLISDFVTLGSPLTHASFLLAANLDDLQARQDAREMPRAPPRREGLVGKALDTVKAFRSKPFGRENPELFCFPLGNRDSWQLDHGALFAAVRWTNIYDQSRLIAFGDQISGPLKPYFGQAIIDIDLADIRGQAWRFTHTKYWDSNNDPRVLDCLRDALNITDDPVANPTLHAHRSRFERLLDLARQKKLRRAGSFPGTRQGP